MNTKRRFVLDEERQIIDTLNPADLALSRLHRVHEDEPDDERYLRERVLNCRLDALIHKLIINQKPKQIDRLGREDEPFNNDAYEISLVMFSLIPALLHVVDPGSSTQHARAENSVRTKERTRDLSSLSLFVDDIELLLRDLYGDVDIPTLDRIRPAVLSVVLGLTKYVRKDLWQEHEDAIAFDNSLGIGIPDGYGISGSDRRGGLAAQANLVPRIRDVESDPSAFSEYTVGFAKLFGERWDFNRLDPEDIRLSARPTFSGTATRERMNKRTGILAEPPKGSKN
jgi:hypothetical protein